MPKDIRQPYNPACPARSPSSESVRSSAALLPQHQKLLEGSAINEAVAEARGYRSITEKEELLRLGFSRAQTRVPDLLIPLWRVDGEPGGYQYRPDNPRTIRSGRPIKYETPKHQTNVLDVPPTVRDRLPGPEAILITEGARKADALAFHQARLERTPSRGVDCPMAQVSEILSRLHKV